MNRQLKPKDSVGYDEKGKENATSSRKISLNHGIAMKWKPSKKHERMKKKDYGIKVQKKFVFPINPFKQIIG